MVMSAVICQLCALVLVPSDGSSTFRFSIFAFASVVDVLFQIPHSFIAKFASAVEKVERNVMTLVARDGYVASIPFMVLEAPCNHVWFVA